ncbi:MspA family porin [Nocardia iowensis]|uniref:MspA family porin n=1 Tax=Nocardia iowensis TaxID=204891 RepID=A0ABX8RPL1_NOCIO|nr:MspA family porin [Nocardia iowensis]QXN90844.1 MspA family porin [Nocardia iowensis]
MINRKKLTRQAGLGAAAAVALGLFSTGAADADIFIPLPGGETHKTLADGTVVTIELVDESADINLSVGATPEHRSVWVSGTAQVELSGTPEGKGGSIFPGYTVGCEVDIAGGGAAGGLDWSGNAIEPNAGTAIGGNLSLGPGQMKSFYVLDLEQGDDFGSAVHETRNQFEGNHGSVSWADETIDLTGCGGPAQARAFVSLSVETDQVVTWMTLWGEPFTI